MMTYLILVLQFVCLSLWVGGATVLLSVVSPSVFRSRAPEGAEELMILISKRYAGLLAALQIFLLAMLSLQLLLLSSSLYLRLRLALSLTALAILLTVYFRFTFVPHAENQDQRNTERTDVTGSAKAQSGGRFPGRMMTLLTVNLFLGLCVVIVLILPL